MAVVRSPYAHAKISAIDTAAAKAAEGVVAVFTGADLRDDWKAAMPCAWPVTEDMKSPEHFPLAVSEVALPGRRRRGRDRRHARARRRRGRARRRRLRAARRDRRRGGRGRGRLHTRPRGARHERLAMSGSSRRGASTRAPMSSSSTRYVQPPLIPNAIEPRGVLARPEPGGDVTLWSATQIPHILRLLTAASLGLSETKLRVIAPDVGGGFGSKLDVYAEEFLAVALARRLGAPIKWIEERSENATATIHGRDFVTTLELAATKDGKITAIRADVQGRDGRLPAARHAGHPAARRLDLRGPVRDPELRRHVHRRLHEHDADRRVPRCRPPRGDLRARADDGPAGQGAGHRPDRAATEELHRRVPCNAGLGPHDRRRRLPRVARPAARTPRPGRDRGGAALAARARRREADRRRLLDLQRDVRARSVADPRCDPLRGRRLGAGDDPLPAHGHVPGRDGHVAARPGPRDGMVADRRRQARLRSVRGGGAARGHERVAVRDGHLRKPLASRRRRGALGGRREDHREGARDRRAPARGLGRRPRVRARDVHRQGLAGQGDDGQGRGVGGLDGPRPAGRDGAGARGDGDLRPAELLLAGGRARRGRRGGHRDGRRTADPVRRDRRRRHGRQSR